MSTVDQNAELTEGQAFEVIRQWSEDRPAWQRDALRRIIVHGTLSEKDLDELTAICCDPTAKGVPLDKSHLKQPAVLGEPISLHRVTQAKGINALPDNQELEFAPKGLTIIYGDNGSGKSGYVRILKNACRTRDGQTNIRRNVEDATNTPQSATIGFMRGAVSDSFAWTPQATTHAELPSVSIFDTRSANIHVEKTNAVAYIPAPMQVMEALAAACDAVKLRIDAQVTKLQAQTPHVIRSPALSLDTAAGAFLHRLSAKSNLKQLELLSTVSAEEARRLTELEADLAQDPKKVVARLTAQRTKLQNIRAQLAKLTAVATDDAFKKRDTLQADLKQRSEAARLASDKLFAATPLPDVGKEAWRSLWEAARRYSDQVAYPARRFPTATAEKDLCVLCQQPLSTEAVNRQQTFESFVRSTTRADELAAEKAASTFMDGLEKSRLQPSAYFEGVAHIATELGDEALAEAMRHATTIAAWRLRAIVKGKKRPCAAVAFPDAACATVEAGLSDRITKLSADGQSPARLAMLRDRNELKDKQAFSGLAEDVKAQIIRLQEVAKLEAAAKDAQKRLITTKNKELSDKLVTNALRGRFAREVEKLKLSRMPVELKKVRDSNAVSYFQVVLVEKPTEPIGEILSEGEHRCIALAAFLAELVTSKQYSGIVFDDPMSSLDHIHRKAVAARLVEEAAHRQVVVFTHDLTFLYELRREADAKGQTIRYQTVFRRNEKPGHIEGELPNKARSALQLANAIRSELKAIKADFDKWPEVRRTLISKGVMEQLREAWDQAIADFIYPVLGRFDNTIKGNSLFKLAVLTEADVATVTEARRRLSEDLHLASQTLNPENVTHQQLVDEVKKLEDFAHDIESRQKKATAPTVSFAP
jgi:ABC-type hemin transport system ATPase subunit